VLDLYGYKTRHGFMVCPFHGDTDASLKVYKGTGGWHCFGCGKGGSVVDFVMEQEGCDFRTAVAAIDKALRLGLTDPTEDPYEAEKVRRMQQWFDSFVAAVNAYLDAVRMKIEADMRIDLARLKELEMLRRMEPPQLTAADYDFISQWKEEAQYNEYRLEKIEELREEVAAWRRKARRVKSA
jgi:DNA primase